MPGVVIGEGPAIDDGGIGMGAGSVSVFVLADESGCEKPEIKFKHTIAPKKNFLNIVLDLKINNERGVAD